MRDFLNYLRAYIQIKRKHYINRYSKDRHTAFTPFLILCSPRTGSTLLHTYLNSHPNILSYGEFIRSAPEPNKLNILHNGIFFPHSVQTKAVGAKIFYHDYSRPEYQECFSWLSQNRQVKILHLTRRDLLQLFVSEKIAEITGIWSTTKKQIQPTRIRVEPPEFETFIERYTHHVKFFEEFLKDHQVLHITYEQLVAHPEAVLLKAQQFLNVPPRKLFTLLKKQNSRELEEIVVNYGEVSHYHQKMY